MPANCQSNPTVPMKAAAASWLLRTLPTRGPVVAKQQIGLAGDAAEIANTGELPIHPNRADERRASDLIAIDVVDLQAPGIGVAQEHVAGATAAEIANTRELPVQADRAHEIGADDLVVSYVIDLDPAAITLRRIMSVSPKLLKLPKPITRQSKPTPPRKAAPVMLLLAMS